jgi:hypothetical protein
MNSAASGHQPIEQSWRSIILLGRNTASYKFALAQSLIEVSNTGKTSVTLDELAQPFADKVCRHLKLTDKQSTSSSSRFLEACRAFNRNELSESQLISETVARGFNNVIDAFHMVNQDEVPLRFFIDERRSKKGITLTDNIHTLRESFQWRNLEDEVEARWRLVETAWDLGISQNLIAISPDEDAQRLIANAGLRRVDVTSSRNALNGYQRGVCFYCFDQISIKSGDGQLGDVDHFIPWILEQRNLMSRLNGVWNLVLACKECNRGEGGKFARIPSPALLERLEIRNNYFIQSHHPLRETIMRQTGSTPEQRRLFLQSQHASALSYLHHTWEPETKRLGLF